MSEEIEVKSDPGLAQDEKETIIRFSKADRDLSVFSEHPAVIRWCLANPEYTETDRRVVENRHCATTGTLPVGALKLKGHSRADDRLSQALGVLPDDA